MSEKHRSNDSSEIVSLFKERNCYFVLAVSKYDSKLWVHDIMITIELLGECFISFHSEINIKFTRTKNISGYSFSTERSIFPELICGPHYEMFNVNCP